MEVNVRYWLATRTKKFLLISKLYISTTRLLIVIISSIPKTLRRKHLSKMLAAIISLYQTDKSHGQIGV